MDGHPADLRMRRPPDKPAPGGNATVAQDVVAVVGALVGKSSSPIKPRVEAAGFGFGNSPVDGRILIGDALIYIDAARGKPMRATSLALPPLPILCPA